MAIPLAVPLIMTAIGGAVSAAGAASSGAAEASMYNYKAGVAQVNAQIAEQNAQYATAAGETEAQQSGMQTRATLGQIKATQGASNLDVNRGSTVDVRASAAEVGAEDQAQTRANAARQAYGYEVQKTGFLADEQINKSAASNTKTATGFKIASSLLGSATSVADKWYQAGKVGIVS